MKPGAFTQMYIHIVFAVRRRENLLRKEIRPKIFEYMSGIVTSLGHKSININGVADHVHILLGLSPTKSVSDTVHDIKRGTSLYINQNKLVLGNFSWQDGYGAFSIHKSQVKNIYNYISNQEIHHATQTFSAEYAKTLEDYEIAYDPKYLFEFYEFRIP